MEERQPLTVKALTKYIKLKFDYDKNLQHLLLKGELSNVKRHSRGHLYFTLKDDEAQINAVMFASAASHLTFVPTEGMQVVVKGHITVYEAGGSYSMYVKEMMESAALPLFLLHAQTLYYVVVSDWSLPSPSHFFIWLLHQMLFGTLKPKPREFVSGENRRGVCQQ